VVLAVVGVEVLLHQQAVRAAQGLQDKVMLEVLVWFHRLHLVLLVVVAAAGVV
jgi:hypothetical protein